MARFFCHPSDAPHPEEALAFINFMLDPQIAARNSNYVFYANGNKDSQQYLDADVIDDPAIYPPEEVMNNLFTTTPKNWKLPKKFLKTFP